MVPWGRGQGSGGTRCTCGSCTCPCSFRQRSTTAIDFQTGRHLRYRRSRVCRHRAQRAAARSLGGEGARGDRRTDNADWGNAGPAERLLARPLAEGDDRPFVNEARERMATVRHRLRHDDANAALAQLASWRDYTLAAVILGRISVIDVPFPIGFTNRGREPTSPRVGSGSTVTGGAFRTGPRTRAYVQGPWTGTTVGAGP